MTTGKCVLCFGPTRSMRTDAETMKSYPVCQYHLKCQYQEFKAAVLKHDRHEDLTEGTFDGTEERFCEHCGRRAEDFFVSDDGVYYAYCSRHHDDVARMTRKVNQRLREEKAVGSGKTINLAGIPGEAIKNKYEAIEIDDANLLVMYDLALEIQRLAGQLDAANKTISGAVGSMIGNAELIIANVRHDIRERYEIPGGMDAIHVLMCLERWREWKDGNDDQPRDRLYTDIRNRLPDGFDGLVNGTGM